MFLSGFYKPVLQWIAGLILCEFFFPIKSENGKLQASGGEEWKVSPLIHHSVALSVGSVELLNQTRQ